MLRFTVVISVLIQILTVSAHNQDVYKSMALRIMRFVYIFFTFIADSPLSLSNSSEEAWEGLEKPLGTFRTETFAECGEKCSGLDGCGMMHFNRHDNRGYKWCTPAKVVSFTSYFTVQCLMFNVYILRLAASTQIIRSA